MANRFEQVDEVQPDAIAVILEQRGDGRWAKVFCPASAHEGLREDTMSKDMAPKEALGNAVRLANQFKLAIVVIDSNAIWNKEWGELYRWNGEDEAP